MSDNQDPAPDATPPQPTPDSTASPQAPGRFGLLGWVFRGSARGDEPVEGPLFRNDRFVSLWAAQAVAQTTNTALQFVLLILIVEKTGSSLAGSGLIIALASPPVVFGLVSGVLVDRWDKRTVMIITNTLRAVLTVLLIFADDSLIAIYAITFLTSTMGQFFLPAAASAVPSFVTRRQLLSANSAFIITLTFSQLVGMVFLAPIMLKALGFDASYILAAALILVTVPMIGCLPGLPSPGGYTGESWRDRLAAVPTELSAAWHAIRADRLTTLALLQLASGGMLLFIFALLVPRFVQEILEIDADNAVFIFWPTGIGALLALRLLPRLGRRYSGTGIVTAALFGLTLVVAAMGGINFFVDFLQDKQPFGVLSPDQVGGVSLLVFITLLFAFPLGIFYGLVNAPAQTELHKRAPEEMRGRIFSAQLMLANGVSMVVLLAIGGVADAIGIELVLFVVAGITLGLAVMSVQMRRLAARDASSGPSPAPT